jgi:phasin family protein
MFPTQDQISAATKANLEASLALYSSLSSKTLESVEKLISLNLTAAKASMEESSAATRQIFSAKDPQEFLTLVSAQAKPNFDKAVAYGSHVATITNGVKAEFTKAAEEQLAQISRKVNELVEQVAKNAPAGSESVVALAKTTLANAATGYEQMTKAAKQAFETFEANLNVAAAQAKN